MTQIRAVLRLGVRKRHQLYNLYLNHYFLFCEHQFVRTKLWKGDSRAHFTAV